MEPTTTNWLDRVKLATFREFFAYILVAYFLYQNKEIEKEKTEILKAQVEVLSRDKDTQLKLIELTQKLINKNYEVQKPNDNNSD